MYIELETAEAGFWSCTSICWLTSCWASKPRQLTGITRIRHSPISPGPSRASKEEAWDCQAALSFRSAVSFTVCFSLSHYSQARSRLYTLTNRNILLTPWQEMGSCSRPGPEHTDWFTLKDFFAPCRSLCNQALEKSCLLSKRPLSVFSYGMTVH